VNIIVSVKSRDDGRVMVATYFSGGRNIIVPNMDEKMKTFQSGAIKDLTLFHH
jgi:hypothetical protein